MLLESKISDIRDKVNTLKKADIPTKIKTPISKTTTQRFCNPALAPQNLAPVRLAPRKLVPRISAKLKSASDKFFPSKDRPLRLNP